jgi:hypothetical protein
LLRNGDVLTDRLQHPEPLGGIADLAAEPILATAQDFVDADLVTAEDVAIRPEASNAIDAALSEAVEAPDAAAALARIDVELVSRIDADDAGSARNAFWGHSNNRSLTDEVRARYEAHREAGHSLRLAVKNLRVLQAHIKTIAETPPKSIDDLLFKAYVAGETEDKSTVLNGLSYAIVRDLLASDCWRAHQ